MPEVSFDGLLVDFAGSGNTAAVRLILDLGFDIGAKRSDPPWAAGETALHVAVWRGHLPMVKLLIERGAPLEATHRSGATPLAVGLRALVEQSEWTPNEYSIEIAHGDGQSRPGTFGSRPMASDEIAHYRPSPNPFTDGMRMAYSVGGAGEQVRISVYDLAGRQVRTLADEFQSAGPPGERHLPQVTDRGLAP